jgi:hypothetical protein
MEQAAAGNRAHHSSSILHRSLTHSLSHTSSFQPDSPSMNNPDCRKSLTRKVFAVVCYVPFTIYGLGKLMLYEKVIDKRERSKFNRENKKHNLQALPQQRKRALTLEQPRKEPTRAPLLGRANRMTNAQKKSRLFKLPAEVRCIIWREVLGGHEITIRNWPYYDAKVTRPRNWWAIPRTCRRL